MKIVIIVSNCIQSKIFLKNIFLMIILRFKKIIFLSCKNAIFIMKIIFKIRFKKLKIYLKNIKVK
jgi:hypothetical protein